MGIFTVRKEEHQIRDTEFARFLRRQLNDDSLFTGFNVLTGAWFLGSWIHKDKGVAQDVEDLGPNMEHAGPRLVRQLEQSRQFTTKEELQKRYIARARAQEAQELAEIQERDQVRDWVQKKSGSPIPVLMG